MSKFQHPSRDNSLHIGTVDSDVKAEVWAQYNPKELQIDKPVNWSKHSYTNKGTDQAKSDRGSIYLEFTGADSRTLTIELLFDGFETKTSVAPQIAQLETMATIKDPTSNDEAKRRPPLCVIAWGSDLPKITCVIESLQTKYTMFSDTGTPLRATCTVKLKEADKLGTKDAEHVDPDAGAGAANSGGATPTPTK